MFMGSGPHDAEVMALFHEPKGALHTIEYSITEPLHKQAPTYFTYFVKCPELGNDMNWTYLYRQINAVKPKVLIVFDDVDLQFLVEKYNINKRADFKGTTIEYVKEYGMYFRTGGNLTVVLPMERQKAKDGQVAVWLYLTAARLMS